MVRKGQTVKVLTGKDRGKTGEVIANFPKKGKAIVSGINLYKKHLKPSRKLAQGGIIDKAMPIDVSNLKVVEAEKAKK